MPWFNKSQYISAQKGAGKILDILSLKALLFCSCLYPPVSSSLNFHDFYISILCAAQQFKGTRTRVLTYSPLDPYRATQSVAHSS